MTPAPERADGAGPTPQPVPVPRRIWLLGPPGAGKTTLGRQLAERLGRPHHELDAFFWHRGWTRADGDRFCAAVAEMAAGEAWIADGQYHEAHSVLASRADAVVWLDVPLRVALTRVARRTLRRLVTRTGLWNGNRETPGSAWSLLVWTVRSHRDVAAVNRPLLARLAAQGVHTVRTGSAEVALAQLLGAPPATPAPVGTAEAAPAAPCSDPSAPDGARPLAHERMP